MIPVAILTRLRLPSSGLAPGRTRPGCPQRRPARFPERAGRTAPRPSTRAQDLGRARGAGPSNSVSRPGDGVWPVIVTARPVMIFAAVLFPGLSSLVIDEVEDTGVVLRLRARTSIPKGV